jgi:hypothetical protein
MNSSGTTCPRLLLVVCALGLLPTGLMAQSRALPPRDNVTGPTATTVTATLKGRVTSADTGEALPRVIVSLLLSDSRAVPLDPTSPNPRPPVLPETITDDLGRFDLADVPAGSYTLTASRTGFVTLSYGQQSAFSASRPVVVRTGQAVEGLDIALPRGAVVTGQLLDPEGQPAAGGQVQLYRRQVIQGRVRLVETKVGIDLADDQGLYRLYGIPNGTYVVAARPGSTTGAGITGAFNMALPTYYPGTAVSADARPIVVTGADEVPNVSFAFLANRPATLTVAVANADGTSARDLQVWMLSEVSGGRGLSPSADGKYRTTSSQVGRYTIDVEDRKNERFARTEVVLDGTDLDVSIVLVPGHTLRGRITFASGKPPAALTPRMIQGALRYPGGESTWPRSQLSVKNDWTFEIRGLGGALRLEPVVQNPALVVNSIRIGGRESIDGILDFGRGDINDVEVVISDRFTEIVGLVRTRQGVPAPDATVVVFPEESARWESPRYIAAVRTESNGAFTYRGLPPGRYLAAAVDYLESGTELDPDTLQRLKVNATPVALVEDERRTIDLSVGEFE